MEDLLIWNPIPEQYGVIEGMLIEKLQPNLPQMKTTIVLKSPKLVTEDPPARRNKRIKKYTAKKSIDIENIHDVCFQHPSGYCLTYEKLLMPILEVCKEMGVGVSCLKKWTRELGIRRWPARTLRALEKLVESNTMNEAIANQCALRETFSVEKRVNQKKNNTDYKFYLNCYHKQLHLQRKQEKGTMPLKASMRCSGETFR